MTTHPDLIEAAIRMLADEGYRVFKSKHVQKIDATYAVRPGLISRMSSEPPLEYLLQSRVLQDLSINVAQSSAVRWDNPPREGEFGLLLRAHVTVILPDETEV